MQRLRLGQPAALTEPSREAELRAEGRIKVDAGIAHDAPDGWFKPGAGKVERFKDHPRGPEMVAVPAGSFTMGSPESEHGRFSKEGPQHEVTFARPFAVSRFAVSFNERDAGAPLSSREYPVTDISWDDAKAHVARLAKQTGKPYRLLSEAEWEYLPRAAAP
jgi:formylglycine-generating enzyme required for sulfatase activity